MFAEERPALQPLPLEPFRYYQYRERTVYLDGSVEVEAAYYDAPPGWIGRQMQVQWEAHQVRRLDPKTGQLLHEHRRQVRGRVGRGGRAVLRRDVGSVWIVGTILSDSGWSPEGEKQIKRQKAKIKNQK
jgi:hypothetical protein